MPERNFLLPVFRIHNDFPLCYHFLHYTTTQHFFTIFNNFFVHFRLFSCIFITYVCLSDKFECRVLFRICQNPDMAVRQMLIVYLQRIFHLNRNLFLFLLHIHTVGINSHQQAAVWGIIICNIFFIFFNISPLLTNHQI